MKIGQEFWYCSRISEENAEISTYSTPIKDVVRPNYLTIMPATARGYVEVLKYGETLQDTWTIIANANAWQGKLKIGDLMWVDGEKPITNVEKQYGNGASATAEVINVAYVNKTISITLRRNQNQVKL